MNPRVVICHISESAGDQLATALVKSRVAVSADVSVGFARAGELISEPNRVDACLIDSSLIVKCLERDRNLVPRRGHTLRKIVLAPAVPNSLIIQVAQAGMDDVIDMSTPADRLLDILKSSISGQHGIEEHPIWRSIRAPKDVHEIASPYRDFIDREIVSMISAGLTDDEISKGVYLSCQTVRNRISRMLERSGARNRTQLATLYVRDQYNEFDHRAPESLLLPNGTNTQFAVAI